MQEEPGVAMIPVYLDPRLMEAINGIATKRRIKIDEMVNRHIPKWRQWIVNNTFFFGRFFRYGFKMKQRKPRQGEMSREEITLCQGKREIETITFVVTLKEGENLPPSLTSMLPRTQFVDAEWNQDKPTKPPEYIG